MPVYVSDSAGVVAELIAQFGHRPATSAAEAMAAAQINARLRQAGFSVATHSLPATAHPGKRFTPVATALMVAIGLAVWQPLVGAALGLWLMALVLVDGVYAPLPSLRQQSMSQNIIAVRPIEIANNQAPTQPRWRLVLLAPLDTPPVWQGLARLIAPSFEGLLARLALGSLPLAIATGAIVWPALRWPLTFASFASAWLFFWISRRQLPLRQPDGGIAALATLIITGQNIPRLQHVEVWAVAVGAAHCDHSGIKTLIARYPFDPANTLIIGLGSLAYGQLAIMSRHGIFRHETADPLLYRLAIAADRADPGIDLEPHSQAARDELLSPLRQRGFRTLKICAVPNGDTTLNPLLSERAARLIIAIACLLDAETNDDLSILRAE
ncbi:hypothetical protein [Chloroflexus sp.]|uniref:hypothetical protein n=1 Tax=Chloroflexus sp. TaxID=1904827 RepID=UPI00298ED1AD|nr:hypothetical protein [Chloroflexus sp.]MDW8402902.1 hypothetical protein [Chloroflexus sp.]